MKRKIAQKTLADHIEEGNPLPGGLPNRAEQIRNMLADTDFDQQVFDQNADYVQAFSDVSHTFDLSGFEVTGSEDRFDREFNGTLVKFRPKFFSFTHNESEHAKGRVRNVSILEERSSSRGGGTVSGGIHVWIFLKLSIY